MAEMIACAVFMFIAPIAEMGINRGMGSGTLTLAVLAFFITRMSRLRPPLGVLVIFIACLWTSFFAPSSFFTLTVAALICVVSIHALNTTLSHPDSMAAALAKVLGSSLVVCFSFILGTALRTQPNAWTPWVFRTASAACGIAIGFHLITNAYAHLFRPHAVTRNTT
jgi:hypothetical protein